MSLSAAVISLLLHLLAPGSYGLPAAVPPGGDGLWVMDGCSSSAGKLARIQPSDSVGVRYSVSGEEHTCYAVTVAARDTTVQGYLLGTAHPAVAGFEQEARRRVPAVAIPQQAKPASPPSAERVSPRLPVHFAGLRATDVKGRRVDLDAMSAPVVILYFWSARDQKAIKDMEMLGYVYQQYHPRGVDLVGVASGQSPSAVIRISQEHEATWSQILDTGGIAKKYQVVLEKPYYVLDRRRNVITGLSSANDIDASLQRLKLR